MNRTYLAPSLFLLALFLLACQESEPAPTARVATIPPTSVSPTPVAATQTAVPVPTFAPTEIPRVAPTLSVVPTPITEPSVAPASRIAPTPSPAPTSLPTPTATATPTAVPTVTPSATPSLTPAPTPALEPDPLSGPIVKGDSQKFRTVSEGNGPLIVSAQSGRIDFKLFDYALNCSVPRYSIRVTGEFYARWCQAGQITLSVADNATGASQEYSLDVVTPTPAPTATPLPTPTPRPTLVLPRPPQQVAVVSGGVAAHGANLWQVAGFTGKGVKIGIIDAGYDSYHSLAGSELPLKVEVMCFTDVSSPSSSDINDCARPDHPEWVRKHGIGSMEVLFDFAPDAAYYVTNFHHGLDNLREAVDWMIANGVDVINASQQFGWHGPGDGTSPYSNSIFSIIDAAVTGGAIWVSSADNERFSSWLGPFYDPDGNGYHNWSGEDECNDVNIEMGDFPFSGELRWEDSWPGALSDLDMYLRDSSGNVVLHSEGASRVRDSQRGRDYHRPHEVIGRNPDAEGTYCLAVRHQSGPLPRWIELSIRQFFKLEHFTDGGGFNTAAESRNPGLLAVGAADWRDTHTIMPYSSRGPTTDGRTKPDITGATNGLSVGFGREYGGTSGASPHIAGLAALVKSRFPDYSPEEIADYLKDNAAPRGDVPNNAWGYGFATLPKDGIEIPPSPDRDTLIAFYHATGGPNWRNQENWLSDRHIDEWSGVDIDRHNRVIRLDLQDNGLSGTIPPLLKDLHSLQDLNLGVNRLSGDIPPELGALTNLTRLNLGTNRLSGEIPSELSNLAHLRRLHLDNNWLSGEIPTELGQLSNLTYLGSWNNQLSGEIPPELGGLSKLKWLYLDYNRLAGPIPTGLGNLTNLSHLHLYGNQLSGEIPPQLGNLTNLTRLGLQTNLLSGQIPEELSNLGNLAHLYLDNNQLTGCIPVGLRDVLSNDLSELGLPSCGS